MSHLSVGEEDARTWQPPISIRAYEDEPVPALLVRFVDVHGWPSLRHFCTAIGARQAQILSGVDLHILATKTQTPLPELERRLPIQKARSLSYFGNQLSVDWLIKKRRRVCPSCIAAEGGHHKFWWDLSFIDRCQEHGVELTSRCSCGGVLTYNDADNLKCGNCSRDGLDAAATTDGLPPRPFQDWCLARMGRGNSVTPVPLLDELPLATAIHLVIALCTLYEAGYSLTQPTLSASPDGGISGSELVFRMIARGDIGPLVETCLEGFVGAGNQIFDVAPIAVLGWFERDYAYRFEGVVGGFEKLLKSALARHLAFPVTDLYRKDYVSIKSLAHDLQVPTDVLKQDLEEAGFMYLCPIAADQIAIPTNLATDARLRWFQIRHGI